MSDSRFFAGAQAKKGRICWQQAPCLYWPDACLAVYSTRCLHCPAELQSIVHIGRRSNQLCDPFAPAFFAALSTISYLQVRLQSCAQSSLQATKAHGRTL